MSAEVRDGSLPDDFERVVDGRRQVGRAARGFESKFRFLRPEGTVAHHQLEVQKDLRASQERVELVLAGKPLRMLGVDIDIEIAHRSEEQSRLALHLALAQERERTRIAAGLHDEVGQILAIARAKLGQLMETGAQGDVPGRAGGIRALVDRAIAEIRALTFELSSPVLHELGLAAAVESLCERLGEESGVHFRVVAHGEPEWLGEDLRTLLYRAVRELCSNVVKHAQASRAEVRLNTAEDQIGIVVADDGEGFDASARARPFDTAGGFGLFSIRQMCAQVGGSFEIESEVGKGARATITVPRG